MTDETAHLPLTQHSSQLKMKAACNCGRKQADKDDPFDHKVRDTIFTHLCLIESPALINSTNPFRN